MDYQQTIDYLFSRLPMYSRIGAAAYKADLSNTIQLLEETGYEFTSAEYLGRTSPNPSTNNNLMHMFLLQGGKKVQEQELDHNEEIEVHLYKIEELFGMLDRNEIVQSMHVTAIFFALKKMGLLQFKPA
jgi:hypothetical protein